MAEPSKKAPEINKLLAKITGRDRVKTIRADKCTTCGLIAKEFKNASSHKEYLISGMCQSCQDSFFG